MLRIAICCGGGFSSSALAAHLEKESEEKGLKERATFIFIPILHLLDRMNEVDVAMVCPHMEMQVRKDAPKYTIPVTIIPPRLYGLMPAQSFIEDAEDIYQAIAERYLAIGCSVMTPDTNRYELLERLLDEYQVEGVVEMTLQACHTYNIEAKSIEKRVKEKGLPYIHIETDYSQADVGQLDTRIAAFLEMI